MFKGPLVLAIKGGWKTQTRRPLYVLGKARKNSKEHTIYRPPQVRATAAGWPNIPVGKCWQLSHLVDVKVGDRFYVKETYANIALKGYPPVWFYRADGELPPRDDRATDNKWRSSMFMPRAAARLVLEVTEVRIQRLHAITERDAAAEGATMWDHYFNAPVDPDRRTYGASFRRGFQRLWESINGEEDWLANNWVLAFTFRRIDP